jgi:hypothetical protein
MRRRAEEHREERDVLSTEAFFVVAGKKGH